MINIQQISNYIKVPFQKLKERVYIEFEYYLNIIQTEIKYDTSIDNFSLISKSTNGIVMTFVVKTSIAESILSTTIFEDDMDLKNRIVQELNKIT